MWPWEHVAVGYVCYSLLRRARGGPPPRSGAAWAAVLGSLFPDLVDKPLAWSFGLLPSGVSMAHSVFVAVPLSVGVWLATQRVGAATAGAAFAVGYLLHLPADLAYPLLLSGRFTPQILLWPVVTTPSSPPPGLLANVEYYLRVFVARLRTRRGLAYVALELLLLAGALIEWWTDGRPGLSVPRRSTDR